MIFKKVARPLLFSDYESMFFGLSSGCDESKKSKIKGESTNFPKKYKISQGVKCKNYSTIVLFQIIGRCFESFIRRDSSFSKQIKGKTYWILKLQQQIVNVRLLLRNKK